jgi:single-strand DNA-binding protein
MINKVFLLGNLGSDPQVKFTKDGVMMVIFRVATNEFIRRNGTYEKITDWHTVRVFGKLAEFCSKLKKGDRVFIEGKLKSSSFEIDNKIFRVSTVIAKSVKLIPQGLTKEEIDRGEIYNNEDFGIEQEEELPF